MGDPNFCISRPIEIALVPSSAILTKKELGGINFPEILVTKYQGHFDEQLPFLARKVLSNVLSEISLFVPSYHQISPLNIAGACDCNHFKAVIEYGGVGTIFDKI